MSESKREIAISVMFLSSYYELVLLSTKTSKNTTKADWLNAKPLLKPAAK